MSALFLLFDVLGCTGWTDSPAFPTKIEAPGLLVYLLVRSGVFGAFHLLNLAGGGDGPYRTNFYTSQTFLPLAEPFRKWFILNQRCVRHD